MQYYVTTSCDNFVHLLFVIIAGLASNLRTEFYGLGLEVVWPWPWPQVGPALASNTLSSNPLTDCNVSLCSGLSGLTQRMCERLQVLHYLINIFYPIGLQVVWHWPRTFCPQINPCVIGTAPLIVGLSEGPRRWVPSQQLLYVANVMSEKVTVTSCSVRAMSTT